MKPKKMFLGGLLGRKTKDQPVKKATRRGRGPGVRGRLVWTI